MSESRVEPTENSLSHRLEQLDRQIAEQVERVVREFRQEMGERVRQSSDEMLRQLEDLRPAIPEAFITEEDVAPLVPKPPPREPRRPAVGDLLEAVARVDSKTSQAEILMALLEEGRRFASRTAFFLLQANEIRGWASQGFEGATHPVEQLVFGPPADSAWTDLAKGVGALRLSAEECGDLSQRLGVPAAARGVLVPFVLRGQIAGALYADREPGAGSPDLTSLQLLSHSASMALETAAVRGAGGSAALRPSTIEEEEEEEGDELAPMGYMPEPTEEPSAPLPTAVSPVEEPPAVEALEVEPMEPAVEAVVAEPEAEPHGWEIPAVDTAAPGMEVPVVEPMAVEPELEMMEVEASMEELALAEPPDFMEPEPMSAEPEVEFIEPPEEEDLFETSDEIPLESSMYEFEPEADYTPVAEVEESSDIWAAEEEEEPTVIGQRAKGEVPLAPPPPVSPDTIGQQTVRLDISTLQDQQAGMGMGAGMVRPSEEQTAPIPSMAAEPPTQPEFELEPEVPEDVGFELEPEPESMLEPPSAMPPTQVRPPADMPPSAYPSSFATPAPAAAPTPAAPTPTPRSTGGTEVSPPSDLQGPGLAFASQPPSPNLPKGEEAALHEEARRLARLLVSEIKLYNEEVIEEGRRAGNIYSRLKEDIDRSRQMYEERIDPRLQGKDDYFYQELVQRLAGGDPKLLGI